MKHFGSVVILQRITHASEVLLIGDTNQLPFIERENFFRLY